VTLETTWNLGWLRQLQGRLDEAEALVVRGRENQVP
jgi:hypothetical protein